MLTQYTPINEVTFDLCENPDCRSKIAARYLDGTVLPVSTSVMFMVDTSTGLVWCFCCRVASILQLTHQQALPALTPLLLPQLDGLSVTADDLLGAMEARWKDVVKSKKRGRPELAVGLRFAVFQRDGFRCQYCGLSARSGALLHADHVIPESKGGLTTMENLVTACVDCNLGKSAKELSPEIVAWLTS